MPKNSKQNAAYKQKIAHTKKENKAAAGFKSARINSRHELKKSDFLVLKNQNSEIQGIVAPNSFEIGLPTQGFNDIRLTVNGRVQIQSELTTPAAPSQGKGGVLYAKSDGKIYWRSADVSETDLTTGGGGGAGTDGRLAEPSSGQLNVTGSFGVSGSLYVAEYLYHIGDTDTYLRFTDDTLRLAAGGKVGFSLSEGNSDQVFIGTTHNASVGAANKYDQVMILSGGAATSVNEGAYGDIALYVSGAKGSRGTATKGTALFGGDVVVSGTLYAEKQVIEVDQTTTGSLSVSGSLVVSQSADISGGLTVNNAQQSNGPSDLIVFGTAIGKELITTKVSDNVVMILSGGAAASSNEFGYKDMALFVSGTVGSRGTTTRGTALFGGDTVVSGALHVEGSLTVDGEIPTTRYKTVYEVTGTHITGTPLDAGDGVNFTSASYNFNNIDVLLNGQLLASGTSADYTLLGSKTGSINFNFELRDDDMITILVLNK